MPTSDHSRNRTRHDEPERAAEALARARTHTHAAIAEALAAVHALLDASSLALSGEASASNTVLGPIARILEGLRAEFDESATTGEAAALLRSIAEALDAEIARWETRSESDPEARAVWRAFLGLRELLWEFGIRRESDAGGRKATAKPAARKKGRSASTRRKQPRVQRVTVEE
ncbi:MAG: hypothetical protein ACC649_00295 [Myxococcota bacterium]